MIEEIFKYNNIKLTKQRKNIYEIILRYDGFCTSKVILENSENLFDKTTMYRVLDLFLEKQMILKKVSIENEVYYEINSKNHEHYIKCIKCNKKKIIPNDEIEKFEKSIMNEEDLISHNIDFFVICTDCKNKFSKK